MVHLLHTSTHPLAVVNELLDKFALLQSEHLVDLLAPHYQKFVCHVASSYFDIIDLNLMHIFKFLKVLRHCAKLFSIEICVLEFLSVQF